MFFLTSFFPNSVLKVNTWGHAEMNCKLSCYTVVSNEQLLLLFAVCLGFLLGVFCLFYQISKFKPKP